jgi:hypothetical protein
MGRPVVYTVTACPAPRKSCREVLRGLRAVAVLLLSAADALIAALLGVPTVARMWGRLAALWPVVRTAYRHGAHPVLSPAIPINPIDPSDSPDGPAGESE